MSKQINPEELAKIVADLLTKRASGANELDEERIFAEFMTRIAETVCEFCGGEVHYDATRFEDTWYVGIHGNDSLPDPNSNIWTGYDSEGELFDENEIRETKPIPVEVTPPRAYW